MKYKIKFLVLTLLILTVQNSLATDPVFKKGEGDNSVAAGINNKGINGIVQPLGMIMKQLKVTVQLLGMEIRQKKKMHLLLVLKIKQWESIVQPMVIKI